MQQLVLIAGIAIALVWQFFAAGSFRVEARTIIRLQAVFWTLAYVIRPLYVIVISPEADTPLGDRRLTFDGYGASLTFALQIVIVGQLAFLIAMLTLGKAIETRMIAKASAPPLFAPGRTVVRPSVFMFLYGLGWAGRGLYLIGVPEVASATLPFATVGGCMLVLLLPNRASKDRTPPAVWAVVALEGAWAGIYASKAAIIAVVIALVIRWCGAESRSGTRNRRITGALAGMCFAFVIIQPLKGIDTASEQMARAANVIDTVDAQLVAVLERFDGLSAVVDASSFPYSHWLSPKDYAARAVLGAIPKGPFIQLESTLGQQWTREVKAQSFDDQYLNVSLAAGPSAEGFVNWGYTGAAVESALLAVVTILCSSGLTSRRLVPSTFASFYIFSTVLFEQGILGVADATAKAIQLGLCAYVLALLIEKVNWSSTERSSTTHRSMQ